MITEWFNKWFYNQAKKAWENKDQYEGLAANKISVKEKTLNSIHIGHAQIASDHRIDSYPDLNFKMYSAENGYVMEVRHIDRKTERQSTNLHVITDDQDLGEAISHIITLESLKIK